MTVKCTGCGTNYDRKYNVCPSCGTVRLVLPLWSKAAAAVSGVFLALTLIMLVMGVFDFGGEKPEDSIAATDTPVITTETQKPENSEPPESTPTTEPDDTPSKETQTPVTLKIDGSYYDSGFTMYIGGNDVTLTLTVLPEPTDGSEKPVWESSNPEVFKVEVDSNNPFKAVVIAVSSSGKNETLTIKYGSAEKTMVVSVQDTVASASPSGNGTTDDPASTDSGNNIDSDGNGTDNNNPDNSNPDDGE